MLPLSCEAVAQRRQLLKSDGGLEKPRACDSLEEVAVENGHEDFAYRRGFVDGQKLGGVVSEMDFRLSGETVRRPDVAFISADRLRGIDLEKVPIPIVPDLVIEIVSKNDRADDLLVKVAQYLAAGAKAVWLFCPNTHLAYRYRPGKLEPEVRTAEAGHVFEEPELLPGLSILLSQIFE